jgi:hypothetical protein
MKTTVINRFCFGLLFVFTFLFSFQASSAQQAIRHAAIVCPQNLSWMLNYAAPNGKSDNENEKLVTLPCFKKAVQKALRLDQSFIGKSLPVATAALLSVEVYGVGPASSDHRYITVQGCVRHDCPSVGMIWIDTAGTGQIVFAISRDIPADGKNYSDRYHLWLYSSIHISEEQILPEPLLNSLQNVFEREKFVSAMIVQPDGEMSAALPATLHLNQAQATSVK